MSETKAATTKGRILDAAERLFAQKGFAETSLRDITTAAGANLAAVNYHYQSKEALIHAVFARRVGPVNVQRLENLEALEARAAGAPIPVEDLLRAFIEPMVHLLRRPSGSSAASLMGRVFVEPGDFFAGFFKEHLASTVGRFMALLRRSLPDTSETDLYWSFLFAIGAVGHTMAGLHKINVVSGGRCDASDVDALLDRLLAFIAGGFRTPVNTPTKGDPKCTGSH
jgi:AcrR family transcriptional regulator